MKALERKISSMRPGDVLTAGINQKPGVIGNQVVKDMQRNSGISTQIRRVTGDR
jgi:hypothetical protein